MFLLYDFNYIRQQEFGSKNWETAIEINLSYLDIINLILEILEAMDSAYLKL